MLLLISVVFSFVLPLFMYMYRVCVFGLLVDVHD